MRISDLFESFNSSYQVRQVSPEDWVFTTEKGNEFTITIVEHNPVLFMQNKEWELKTELPKVKSVAEIDFSMDGKFKFLGGSKKVDSLGDNTMKIFSTVMGVLVSYVASGKSDAVFFSGELGLGRLYERMVRRLAPPNVDVLTFDTTGNKHFFVLKK